MRKLFKFRNPFGLSNILTSFTKTQEKLEVFIAKNEKKIEKTRLNLEIKEREQVRAEAVKGRIEEFLNV
ncbi:hypothetical protein [Amphritea sp. HPY]|uniref:hypothetical protein n=1 Tax=Amphritea sp. HPY TaxID=3421652 RepID=UPI003D7DEBE3